MAVVKPDFIWPKVQDVTTESGVGPWIPPKKYFHYKTSYEYGFPKKTPPPFIVEPQRHDECKPPPECEREVNLANYSTMYNRAYDWKFLEQDPINKANLPSFKRFLFLSDFDEKHRGKPARLISSISEYKSKYPPHTFNPSLKGERCDIRPKLICPVKGLTRDDVAKIDTAVPSVSKHLDIYLSRAHMDYVYHRPSEIEKYQNLGMFCESAFRPKNREIKTIERSEDAILQAFDYKLPLGNNCSETIDKFTKPIPPFSEPIGDCLLPDIKQTFGEVIATPGMYHTEYSHIGHDCQRRPLPLRQLRYLEYLDKYLNYS